MHQNEINQTTCGSSIGLIAALSAITMLFAAFTSAYTVRRGLGSDWEPFSLPKILVVTPFLLICGSVLLKIGWKGRRKRTVYLSIYGASFLGMLFLLAEVYAFLKLSEAGRISVYPAAAFFCIFSGSFCVFLVGGIAALLGSLGRGARGNLLSKNVVYYWHYLSVLWLYLLGLLYWGN
jgi:cytochrome c oxidase subunit III